MKWFSRNINPVFVIILTILLYAVIMILSDLKAAIGFILAFPPILFLGMLGLAMCNYLIRFVKWQYYLQTINIRIPPAISLGIFFSGFSMTVTPAKAVSLSSRISSVLMGIHSAKLSLLFWWNVSATSLE